MTYIDMFVFLEPFIAFIAVVVLMLPVLKLAPYLQLLDKPGGRKQHEGAVPLMGGLVIFPVFIALCLAAGFSFLQYWPLYTGLFALLVIGYADDKKHVPAWIKFGVQCVVAVLVVVFGDAHIHTLGNLFGFGNFGLGFISLPFSLAAVVLLINAVNLMDGLDGLAAGSVAVMLGWIAYGFYSGGDLSGFVMTMILIAAVAGFLIYNMRSPFRTKACVFLGDAGSLCLGLSLAWFAIEAADDPNTPSLQPMSVAWILAVPIMDTCAQFYRRVKAGKHPFSPDRGHLHHHFIHAGVAHGKAVVSILCLVFVTGAFGVLGFQYGLPLFVLTLAWIAIILAHMGVSGKPVRYERLISSFALDQKNH